MGTRSALLVAASLAALLCVQYALAAPLYDEQAGMTFASNFGSIAYNVTAVAQSRNGTGPAYLLNGLSNKGYWYQIGIAYDWPTTSSGHYSGFSFAYQVWSPSKGLVYPDNGGGGISRFTGQVNPGDKILLGIYFRNGTAEMSATDWNTGAYANTSFSAEGASYFLGNDTQASNGNGFFTGLMTEWYYTSAYYGDISRVTYTPYGTAPSKAWLWLDEFGCSDGYNCTSKVNVASDYSSYAIRPNPYFSANYHGMNLGFYSNGTFFTGGMMHSLALASFRGSAVSTDVGAPAGSAFNVTLSGGIGPYTYTLYVDNSIYAQSTKQSLSYSGSVSTSGMGSGNHTYYVSVLDSSGGLVLTPTVTLDVNPDPSVVVRSASGASDASIGIDVSYNVTGGTPPYNVTWYLNNRTVTAINGTTAFLVGENRLQARLTDSVGVSSVSPAVSVTINPDPQVAISPSARSADAGMRTNLTASTRFGTPPYRLAWMVDGAPAGSGPSLAFTPNRTGTYVVTLHGNDSAGYAINTSATFTVNPALSMGTPSFSNSSSLFYSGSEVSFSGSVSGGTPPYTYSWYVDGILQYSGNSTSLHYDSVGAHLARLVVTDSAGGEASASYGFRTDYNYVTVAALGAAFVLALLGYAVFVRRKLHRMAGSGLPRRQGPLPKA